jgi:hypothetical protein
VFFSFFVGEALQVFLGPTAQQLLDLPESQHLREVSQVDHAFHLLLVLLFRVLADESCIINGLRAGM